VALVWRDGRQRELDVSLLVPGDVVALRVGDVVPADLRILETEQLECDEAVLTGESMAATKTADPVNGTESTVDRPSCAFMGTVIHQGAGRGVVVATGSATAFGAIAIGITPQLLPAIVSVSLSTGSRALARKRVLVKRLVTIEDLGNIEVLFTDKTGTLTEGNISFHQALDPTGQSAARPLLLGLLCNEATMTADGPVGGNALDQALYRAPGAESLAAELAGYARVGALPFDHERPTGHGAPPGCRWRGNAYHQRGPRGCAGALPGRSVGERNGPRGAVRRRSASRRCRSSLGRLPELRGST
jgi:Mg2+-importing ATPase